MEERADIALVRRKLVRSRTAAAELIRLGEVFADGTRISKPSVAIAPDAKIEVRAELPYVSRGGVKLAYALSRFGINPKGLVVADIGSSTGGFADCLLEHEARKVYCIDVGTGQLDAKLRNDPRIVSLEHTDVRGLTLPETADLAVIDVSFVSLTLILPDALRLVSRDAPIIALVKPQFEVGRERLGKNGIVKSDAARNDAVERVMSKAKELGLSGEVAESPILGGSGNKEFLALLRR